MPLFTVTLSRPSLEYADVFVQAEDANAEGMRPHPDSTGLISTGEIQTGWMAHGRAMYTEYDRDPDPLLDPEESSYSDGNAPP